MKSTRSRSNAASPQIFFSQQPNTYPATLVHTFNVGDVDVELGEFFTGALHALIHRLQDFFGVLFHPSEKSVQTHQPLISTFGTCVPSFYSPFLGEALFDLHLVMAE